MEGDWELVERDEEIVEENEKREEGDGSVQVWPRTIVERAPNHDNTKPSFTAWKLEDEKPDQSTPAKAETRHKWSIQFYDTTPQAGDEEHIRALVQKIHEETLAKRTVPFHDCGDRIDMYGLPLPTETSEEERVARCIAHQRTEIAARNATGRSDFFIPPTFGDWYQRLIMIIDTPQEDWDKGGGPFLLVEFDKLPRTQRSDPDWNRIPREDLDETLWEFRESINWFYGSYVFDGTIYEDLARWSRRSTDGPATSTAS